MGLHIWELRPDDSLQSLKVCIFTGVRHWLTWLKGFLRQSHRLLPFARLHQGINPSAVSTRILHQEVPDRLLDDHGRRRSVRALDRIQQHIRMQANSSFLDVEAPVQMSQSICGLVRQRKHEHCDRPRNHCAPDARNSEAQPACEAETSAHRNICYRWLVSGSNAFPTRF